MNTNVAAVRDRACSLAADSSRPDSWRRQRSRGCTWSRCRTSTRSGSGRCATRSHGTCRRRCGRTSRASGSSRLCRQLRRRLSLSADRGVRPERIRDASSSGSGPGASRRWAPCSTRRTSTFPSPESLFRQMLYGNRWFERELGVTLHGDLSARLLRLQLGAAEHRGALRPSKGFSSQKLSKGRVGDPDPVRHRPLDRTRRPRDRRRARSPEATASRSRSTSRGIRCLDIAPSTLRRDQRRRPWHWPTTASATRAARSTGRRLRLLERALATR